MSNEPLFNIAIMTAVVSSFIGLLRAFGVPITDDQQEAINQLLIAAGPIVVAVIARQYVTPVANPRDAEGVPLSRPDGTQAVTKR